MKLCFSTLGCLEWTLDRVLERAVAYGYQGVDFRGCHGELDLWNCPAFRADGAITRRRFEDAGVRIPCLSSSARMFAPEAERPAMREELLRYVEMAAGIGAGFVRVFGGKLGSTTLDEAIPAAATFLLEAAEIGRQSGVDVLIETHDDWVRSDRLHAAFEAAGFPAGVGVIWDVHHPYRQGGESPETTGARIGFTRWRALWRRVSLHADAAGGGGSSADGSLRLAGRSRLFRVAHARMGAKMDAVTGSPRGRVSPFCRCHDSH